MGAGDVIKSMPISVNIAAITAGNFLNTILLRRIKHVYLLCFGGFLIFSGILIVAEASSLATLFTGTMFMGFAFGIVYPILIGMSIEGVELSQRQHSRSTWYPNDVHRNGRNLPHHRLSVHISTFQDREK